MKLPYNSLKTGWEYFVSKVMPKDAPKIQVEEMRKAFYTGASVMFDLQLDAADKPERTAMRDVSALNDELNNFVKELANGNTSNTATKASTRLQKS